MIDINGSRGVVNSDAPFGDYELTFIATDDSGSLSAPLTREIQIIDMSPPTITLLSQDEFGNAIPYKWALGEAWNADNLRGRAFLASDYPSGKDLTDAVIISGESPDPEILGTYDIELKVTDDSGKLTSRSLRVDVADLTAPEIVLHIETPIVRLLGEELIFHLIFIR